MQVVSQDVMKIMRLPLLNCRVPLQSTIVEFTSRSSRYLFTKARQITVGYSMSNSLIHFTNPYRSEIVGCSKILYQAEACTISRTGDLPTAWWEKKHPSLIHQSVKSNSRTTKSSKDIEGIHELIEMLSIRVFVSLSKLTLRLADLFKIV